MEPVNFFDSEVARRYDRDHGGDDPALIKSTVDVLHKLAGQGPVLEFAIGTGRIALPLSERGCLVKGVELSRAMVDELRKKEAGPPIEIAIGDMTSTKIGGYFSLVFLVFNTIDNLVSQEKQIACFSNAAAHLLPGGCFVVETQVPPIQRLPFGETLLASTYSSRHQTIDEIDIATQRYTSNHMWVADGASKQLSIPFRYVWPSELDLMARLAGMDLEFRWSDWERSPFSNLSKRHISVWRKLATPSS